MAKFNKLTPLPFKGLNFTIELRRQDLTELHVIVGGCSYSDNSPFS